MSINVSSDISVTDIPLFLQNDFAIYKKQIAPIISPKQYKQWISTKGACAVVARNNNEIIGQMWAHPLQIYQNSVPINNQFYWMHNIKVHPAWQNRGIYKEIENYYYRNVHSEEDQQFYLINAKNIRMRHLAGKSKLSPVMNVSGAILFRYLFHPRIRKSTLLRITKSFSPPEVWQNLISSQKMFWVPRFSWDNSPVWFSFYFRNQLICVLQVIQPIHPVQGRFISNIPIIFYTTQIRYLSLSPDFLKLSPSIPQSIFTSLFHLFPHINGFIFTLNPVRLAKLLRFPRFLIPSYDFILYSTIKNPEILVNNLDFRQSFLLL
jgi:hypothetical protein